MQLWPGLCAWGRLPASPHGAPAVRSEADDGTETAVLGGVATHQLGLLLLDESEDSARGEVQSPSNVVVFAHPPDLMDLMPMKEEKRADEVDDEVHPDGEEEVTSTKRRRIVGEEGEKVEQRSPERRSYPRLRFGLLTNVKITQVASTWAHALLLDANGGLFSLGWNAYGQCGTGDRNPVRSPYRVAALTSLPIRSIAAGEKHSLALDNKGRVWGWGSNRYGQLGLEEDVSRLKEWERVELNKQQDHAFKEDDFVHVVPKPLESLFRDNVLIKRVYCGWNYSIVLSQLGQLFSFGWGMYAQLGHGELSNELLPRPIDFTSDELNDVEECEDEIVLEDEEIVDCSCGLWHAAAVTESGKVYTWGYGQDGQIGNGTDKGSSTPKLVQGFGNDVRITQISCGSRHTAVLTDNREVYAWGYNGFGQVTPDQGSKVLAPQVKPNSFRSSLIDMLKFCDS